jgi:hypothetical protein
MTQTKIQTTVITQVSNNGSQSFEKQNIRRVKPRLLKSIHQPQIANKGNSSDIVTPVINCYPIDFSVSDEKIRESQHPVSFAVLNADPKLKRKCVNDFALLYSVPEDFTSYFMQHIFNSDMDIELILITFHTLSILYGEKHYYLSSILYFLETNFLETNLRIEDLILHQIHICLNTKLVNLTLTIV